MPCIDSSRSSASNSAVLSHVAITNFRIAVNRRLQLKNSFVCGREGRTGLVGAKSSFNQGKINFRINSVNNGFRCFFKKLGSLLPRAEDWGFVDIVRKRMLCKCGIFEERKALMFPRNGMNRRNFYLVQKISFF